LAPRISGSSELFSPSQTDAAVTFLLCPLFSLQMCQYLFLFLVWTGFLSSGTCPKTLLEFWCCSSPVSLFPDSPTFFFLSQEYTSCFPVRFCCPATTGFSRSLPVARRPFSGPMLQLHLLHLSLSEFFECAEWFDYSKLLPISFFLFSDFTQLFFRYLLLMLSLSPIFRYSLVFLLRNVRPYQFDFAFTLHLCSYFRRFLCTI
jgi:hypothetical protein